MVSSVKTGVGNGKVPSVNIGESNGLEPSGDKPFFIRTNVHHIINGLLSDAMGYYTGRWPPSKIGEALNSGWSERDSLNSGWSLKFEGSLKSGGY